MKKLLLATLLATSSSIATAAQNDLKVLVAFDSNTTSYSSSQRTYYANLFVKNLNKFITNSSLGSLIDFSLVAKPRIPVASSSWDYDKLQKYYSDRQTSRGENPKTTLTAYQKYYNADVVIVVANPSGAGTSMCGSSYVPEKSSMNSSHSSIGEMLEEPLYSIVFVTGQSSCINDSKVVVHEVGHSFGLQHGRAVQNQHGGSGHYVPSEFVTSGASGFSDYSPWGTSSDYHTVMGVKARNEPGVHHSFFSNRNSYKCGKNGSSVCGDSTANAVGVIQGFANRYAKRSDFFN